MHNSSFCMDFHKLKSIHSVIFCVYFRTQNHYKKETSAARLRTSTETSPGLCDNGKSGGNHRAWRISHGFPRGISPWDFPMNRLDSSKGKDPLELDADFSPKIHRFPGDHLTLGTFPPGHETQIALPPLGLKKKQQIWRLDQQHTWNARNIPKSTSRYGSIDSSELY